jgi:hypothetical protein
VKKNKKRNSINSNDKEILSEFNRLHRHVDEVKLDLTNQINPLQRAFANYRRQTSPDARL